MDVQASPDELPELHECLGSFHVRFRRPAGAEALGRYLTGRRTELPTKHGETIAPAGPGTHAQRLQEFRTNRPWDEAALKRQRGHQLSAEATRGDGVLGVDDTGFPNQGTASAGVARQDSGTLGKGATARGRCPAVTPSPRRAGRWPCGWTCRRPGRTTRTADTRRGGPLR